MPVNQLFKTLTFLKAEGDRLLPICWPTWSCLIVDNPHSLFAANTWSHSSRPCNKKEDHSVQCKDYSRE